MQKFKPWSIFNVKISQSTACAERITYCMITREGVGTLLSVHAFIYSSVYTFSHTHTHPPSHTHTLTHMLTHTHTDDKNNLSCDLHQLQQGGGYHASEELATSIHRKKHQHQWHGGLPHRCWGKCTIHDDVTMMSLETMMCWSCPQTAPTEWHNPHFLDLKIASDLRVSSEIVEQCFVCRLPVFHKPKIGFFIRVFSFHKYTGSKSIWCRLGQFRHLMLMNAFLQSRTAAAMY